ncbi:MAG: ribosome maturation factor RimP [Candidatus Nitrospinota bacterium M3_3B_026]
MVAGQVEKLREILAPVARSEGVELVDVELSGRPAAMTLRVVIDKEGGVSVEDCASVSRSAELVIEAEGMLEGPYTLEVTSPGLTRPLKKPADYMRAIGRLAVLRLREPVDGSRRILGVIDNANETAVTMTLKDAKQGIVIPYENIAKANLEIEF